MPAASAAGRRCSTVGSGCGGGSSSSGPGSSPGRGSSSGIGARCSRSAASGCDAQGDMSGLAGGYGVSVNDMALPRFN
ncbi:hypothetical protein D3878_01185 [Noviherbaspirillum sedimenti]|uniref:Uncharacterized protein n=1 Tax=Noviherbaspirillum sedimenti TaxID=2320865 RepID=A0A3A3FXL0_9BURK|nr:hypothetical protein D3878_01185 [Noviherbaspirillum sedimenti]